MAHLSFSAFLIMGFSNLAVFPPNFRNLDAGHSCEKLRLGPPGKKRGFSSENFFFSGDPNLNFSHTWPAFKFRNMGKNSHGEKPR